LMALSSVCSSCGLLQILHARFTKALIHAVLRDHGVKLDKCVYWPVCVILRKIVMSGIDL
jgi:hypothetical protein